ncbi:hypothetical protein BV912_02140 [Neisseria dumasiana]|uniref:Uncharacterized protein n=1 Tax=Neisseria dumasiana TaxID=1931275 RepID=A0A1X3DKH8_9NEIS|nr:hypothetical protein BV912_02140 [Neisseria dumasiana]
MGKKGIIKHERFGLYTQYAEICLEAGRWCRRGLKSGEGFRRPADWKANGIYGIFPSAVQRIICLRRPPQAVDAVVF